MSNVSGHEDFCVDVWEVILDLLQVVHFEGKGVTMSQGLDCELALEVPMVEGNLFPLHFLSCDEVNGSEVVAFRDQDVDCVLIARQNKACVSLQKKIHVVDVLSFHVYV